MDTSNGSIGLDDDLNCTAEKMTDCVFTGRAERDASFVIDWSFDTVMVTILLIVLNVAIVVGNILVILSVCIYKRMHTFTNVLLMSLATSDALVGVLVTPFSAIDLLREHRWYFGQGLCGMWATSDVLLCTASILNLCVISIDRYFAITSPLQYSRRRTPNLGATLLIAVWVLSVLICTPPWIVPDWDMFARYNQLLDVADHDPGRVVFLCGYSRALAYRIYSASGSFYIPLLVMLFVYWRIFRVANDREKAMSGERGNNMRFTIKKSMKRYCKTDLANKPDGGSEAEAGGDERLMADGMSNGTSRTVMPVSPCNPTSAVPLRKKTPSPNATHSLLVYNHNALATSQAPSTTSVNHVPPPCDRPATAMNPSNMSTPQTPRKRPSNLMAQARQMYEYGMAAKSKPHREKVVYARERKALKTIGIIVFGFIICWLPFFVLYLIDVIFTLSEQYFWLFDLFLWLGYSNSALNPIIYTFCNGDFRRCFRDLVEFGPCRDGLGWRSANEAKYTNNTTRPEMTKQRCPNESHGLQSKQSTAIMRVNQQQYMQRKVSNRSQSATCRTPKQSIAGIGASGRGTSTVRSVGSATLAHQTTHINGGSRLAVASPIDEADELAKHSTCDDVHLTNLPQTELSGDALNNDEDCERVNTSTQSSCTDAVSVHTTILTIRRQPSFIGAVVANC